MATAAREEKQKPPYESLGAGGKFRKMPFRRSSQKTTPYDRPSTALRNPSNGGWISKLVDPAQRLITYSAHRLFSTVFSKRLPPPPPPPSEANHTDKEQVSIDSYGVQQGATEQSIGPRSTSAGDRFHLLEQILEQKTFSRPEIDRLKELLHSRTVDIPIESEEKRSEVVPSMEVVSHDRKEEIAKTPLQDKSANSLLISTPVVSATVLDEDVASPAELAKAYMGSKPSKVFPSMLGTRSQALYEDSLISSSVAYPSNSPLRSVIPRFSSNGAALEIGFATPRSRGRSAIHSMARTPYYRVQTRSTLKGIGSVNTNGAPFSSSRTIWEQSQPSGSKEGALKRRFSVLDNDIGSIGPIRRIRPKPNLLCSRGFSSPVSTEVSQNPSSSTKRPLLLGEPKYTVAKAYSENGDNAAPSTCFSTVPSHSSKAASKIFEHLDKITSPKETSSESKLLTVRDRSLTKLSPSMLRGQALKSSEGVDSSKFLQNACYKNSINLDVSSSQPVPDATCLKHDKVIENGPSRIAAHCDSSTTVANEVESTKDKKDVVLNGKAGGSAPSNTVAHPPEKKLAFKMSAHEYLPDDDDCCNNGQMSGSIADGRVKVDKIAATKLVKPVASNEVKPSASFAIVQKPDSRTIDGFCVVARGATDTAPKPVESDKADQNNLDVEVPFRVPENLVSSSSSSAITSMFSTNSQVANNSAIQSSLGSITPTANINSDNDIATSSAATINTGNILSSVSPPAFSAEPVFKFSTTTTVKQVPENSSLELLGDKNKPDDGFGNFSNTFFAGTPATSASTGSSFLGVPAAAINQLGVTSFSSGSGFRVTGSSAQASPELSFKFEPLTASTAVKQESSSLEFLNDKNKEGGISGGVSSTSFTGTSATTASASSNSCGFSGAASVPTFTNQSLGSALFSSGSGTDSSANVSPSGTGVALLTQSTPVQPGSSASRSVFNFTVNTSFSSGSLAFGSSIPFSDVNPGSSSTATSTVFSSGWLPTTSSKFASPSSSSSFSPAFQFGLPSASSATNTASTSFGASSTSAANSTSVPIVFGMTSGSATTSNSLPTLFGASTASAPSTNSTSGFGLSNGASPTGMFPSTSSATTAVPSQPAVGSPNPVFGFPTVPSGDQMSMEDSMAEDGVHASPPIVPVFGQQPLGTPQSSPTFQVFGQQTVSNPQAPFVFGGPSNGFQFQSQPNQSNSQNPAPIQGSSSLANSQNPSPFQGSESLGNLSNSFSLGHTDKSARRILRVKHSKKGRK